MTQINVCIANKHMHDKHKDQLPLPSKSDNSDTTGMIENHFIDFSHLYITSVIIDILV